MFIFEIFNLNERLTDIAQELAKYKDREDVFISFSDYPKLGIYPSSSYETPIGIYAYPLKEIYQNVVDNTIPFAGNRKFVIVFSANGIKDLNPAAENGYSEADLERDLKNLTEKFSNDFEKIIKLTHTDVDIGLLFDITIKKIQDVLKQDKLFPQHIKNNIFWAKTILIQGINSFISQIDDIEENTINKIEIITKKYHDSSETLSIENIIDLWMNNSKRKNPGGKFWNLTRNLAKELSKLKIRNGRPSAIWTAIMRSLGYEGFTDRTGTGLIHDNEPCQAVFFSTKNIKLVEILQNIRKGEIKELRSLNIPTLPVFINYIDDESLNYQISARVRRIARNIIQLLDTGNCKGANVPDKDKFKESIKSSFAVLLSSARYYPLYTEDKNKKIILDLLDWYMNHPEIWTANNDNQFINTLFSNALPKKIFIHNPRWTKLVMLPKVMKMFAGLAKEL